MDIFGQRFRHFHRETVQIKVILVAIILKPIARDIGCLLADGDHLQANYITRGGAIIHIAHEIGDAITVFLGLARHIEAADFRDAIFFKQDQIIALPRAFPIAVNGLGLQDILFFRDGQHALQHRAQFLLGPAKEIFERTPRLPKTPLELIEAAFIDEGHQRLGGSFQHAGTPEGRCGRGAFSSHAMAALRRIGQIHRGEAARISRAKGAFFVAHLAGTLGLQRGQIIIKAIAHDLVHQMQAIKGIPRIGNPAGSIGAHAIIFHVIARQRRATQQHGNIHALARHFFQIFAHDDGGFH